jgi:PKD repeat protein
MTTASHRLALEARVSARARVSVAFACALIAACGGGGDAGAGNAVAPPPPVPAPAPAPAPGPAPAPAPAPVPPGGTAPVARFTPAANSLRERYLTTFDASASSDVDGRIANFAWDFGDGGTASGPALATGRHAYEAAGSYSVTLTVTDDSGLSHRISQSVVVAPNLALRVAAGARHTLLKQPSRTTTLGFWMQGYSDDYLDAAISYYADCTGHAIGSREVNDPPGPLYRAFSQSMGLGLGIGAMAAGEGFSVMTATNAGDTAFSWGVNWGHLGNGQFTPHRAQFYPVAPEYLPAGTPMAADRVLMIKARPEYSYKERDGSFTAVKEFDTTTRFTGIVQLAAGRRHTLALKRDGTVWAWGNSYFGQLGLGNTVDQWSPQQITALTTRAVAVAAGANISLVLDEQGRVWQSGSFDPAQVLQDLQTLTLRTDLDNVVAIAAGNYQGLALKADGTVWQWGFLVPDPPRADWERTPTAHQVPLLTNIVSVAAGRAFQHAVRADGTLWGWGESSALGDGGAFLDNHTSPVQIGTGINAVVDGEHHAIAIQNDGFLLGWGSNASCQLGMTDYEEYLLGPTGADADTKLLPAAKRYFGRPTAMGRGV